MTRQACAAIGGWLVLLLSVPTPTHAQAGLSPRASEHWVTTWATAQQLAPTRLPFGGGGPVQPPTGARVPATLKDQTVRMIAHASLGGRRVRVALSNALEKPTLRVGAAHVALHANGPAIVSATDLAWTSLLAAKLGAGPTGRAFGVANAGLSGNRLLRPGFGVSALARFDRDVLGHAGVRWMTVLLGINDITFPAVPGAAATEAVTADDLIWGFQQIIERAHRHGIKVAGATIMPVEGVNTYTDAGEAIRQAVNRWIRSSGAFDAVIDFDAAVRDPAHPGRLRAGFDPGDHVHPNDAGNAAMAAAIDVSIFRR